MKNMSMGKLLAIFGGFFLVIIIGAIVAVKIANNKKNSPDTVVKHKTAAVEVATPTPLPASTPEVMHPTSASAPAEFIASGSAIQPLPTFQAQTNTTTQQGQNNGSGGVTAEIASQRAATLESSISNHEERIAALEARTKSSTTKSVRSYKRPSSSKASEIAINLTPRTDYKVNAVVGKRAFLTLPDGSNDSALVGEALPSPVRIKTVDRNDAAVITTSHERITN
jgi:hypothetical protein